jgi:cysteine desulfurase family protein
MRREGEAPVEPNGQRAQQELRPPSAAGNQSLIVTPPRTYFDNAATSWPKPEAVYQAVDRYQREVGAPAGRSGYAEAVHVAREVAAARQAVARLLGADDPSRVIFTLNGTDALNLALHGLLRAGDHVVTSVLEHNSVLRPLRHLEQAGTIRVTRVPCDATGVVDPEAISGAVERDTRVVALVHASNVSGTIQPIEEAGRIAHDHGALLLVDAAQSLGQVPIDVARLPIDLVAAPGHKGLLGPLGTGVLWVAPGVENHLASVRQGGTGSRSEVDLQPEELPDKYEAGNLNVPGLVGLRHGVEWLLKRGVDMVRAHHQALTDRLLAGVQAISGVQIVGPAEAERRVGVVSLRVEGYDPQEVAAALDAGWLVQVRAGLHCAPLAHRALGTLATGGTVRFSIGPFTTDEDVDTAVLALQELTSGSM